MSEEEYYKDNEMYKYLKEHAYISYNKKSNHQFELSVERAQCIANKYHNLTEELQQEKKQLKKDINRILENNYTEEQLDFAVNEVKEQVKAEQQLTDMLHNNIDKLRVKNYELCEENKQLKEELQQFQYDFEKQEAEVFNELEQAINELDLSDKTKEYLIDLMNKDVNIVFGIVEDKIQELKEKYK